MKRKYRPKRIKVTLFWSFNDKVATSYDAPYEPNKMLKGNYRRWAMNLKQLLMTDPLWREERIAGGRVMTKVDFTF